MNEDKKKNSRPDTEDFDLVRSFLENDEKAFDRLVLKYQNRILNLCYRFLGNYEDAEDAAQDAFVKAYKGLKHFRFQAAFYAWLYRIAINTCKNRMASSGFWRDRRMVRLDKPYAAGDHAVAMEVRDTSLSPERMIGQKEKERLIQRAISSLKPKFRQLVILRDVEGLPYEEISSITGKKQGTIKSALSRAREILRKKLKRSGVL